MEPYSSRLELYSSNLELYSSNLELYDSKNFWITNKIRDSDSFKKKIRFNTAFDLHGLILCVVEGFLYELLCGHIAGIETFFTFMY